MNTGCTVLTEAKSTAYARCGPTGAFASSSSTVTQVSRIHHRRGTGLHVLHNDISQWEGGWRHDMITCHAIVWLATVQP